MKFNMNYSLPMALSTFILALVLLTLRGYGFTTSLGVACGVSWLSPILIFVYLISREPKE